MSEDFFARPILNSPYEYLDRHWELDQDGGVVDGVSQLADYSFAVAKSPVSKMPEAVVFAQPQQAHPE